MKPKLSCIITLFCVMGATLLAQTGLANSLTLADAVDQPNWTFVTGGDANWFPQTDTSYDGDHAARSGPISHNQQSWMETTIGPGILDFWWKVSSEQGYDYLEFYIDGERQDRISGEIDWTQQSYSLTEEGNILRWRYAKDESVAEGADTGWIDQISFEPEDPMKVVPEEPWQITAFQSHPLTAKNTYTIWHELASPLNWNASSTVDWLEFSGIGSVDQSTRVTVRTTSKAAEKPLGVHKGQLIFENTDTGVERVRQVLLTMLPPPGSIEITDSITPVDDHVLPFGPLSIGLTRRETIRIRNHDPENSLVIERIQLRPGQNHTSTSTTFHATETTQSPDHSTDSLQALSLTGTPRGNTARPPPPVPDWSRPHDPSNILVRFKKEVPLQARANTHEALAGRVTKRMRRLPVDVVELPPQGDPRAILAAYQKNPAVEYAEPNYRISINQTPNDPRFPDQWALQNTGQSGGLPGADISALQAWQWTTGSNEIIVAVIDTGIDYQHPDLVGNMWINPSPSFGDVHGATWTSGNGTVTNGNPMDDNGHGTHVAGIAGAGANNEVGIAGVNHQVRLMALKFLAADGFGSIADAVAALEYAIDHGAHITNNSWGGSGFSQTMKDMIAVAGEANQLFVAAAGNRGANNDTEPEFPASYALDNIISVASSDRHDERARLSNYGATTVHLAAPGESILSTVPGNGYQFFSGTSMAAPHVTGVAALILSLDPEAEYAGVKQAILDGVTPLPRWESLVISGGRLNAAAALARVVQDFQLLDLPSLPLTLTPGRSLLFEVAYAPGSPGEHEAIVMIESQDQENSELEILLTGNGVIDALEVIGPATFLSEGLTGGPFDPITTSYKLRNNGSHTVAWTALSSIPWLTLSPANGSLAADTEETINVTINTTAQSLPEGFHPGSISFTNIASGLAQAQQVQLHVRPLPGRLSVTDSAPPEDDLHLPFGWSLPGETLTESLTLLNSHDEHDIMIENILLLGGYREDFDDAFLSNWEQKPVAAWTLNDDHYQASNPDLTSFMQSNYTGEVWVDGAFEIEVKRSGRQSSSSALILRATPDFDLETGKGSGIVIGMSGNGFYFIARFINSQFAWIQPWTETGFLNTGTNQVNRLTASLLDDQLHLFANDQLLWTGVTGGPFRPGRIGLAGYTERASPTTHRFNYVDIREPLLDTLLPLSLSQSWRNAHPVDDHSYAFLQSPGYVEPPPVKNPGRGDDIVGYAEILSRQETFRLLDLPDLPFRLTPEESRTFPIHFTPSGEGVFARTVRILSNDADEPVIDLLISGESELDPMRISPLGDFVAHGVIGGPFSPPEIDYRVFHSGGGSLSWRSGESPPWIDVARPSHDTSPGDPLVLSINETANSLPRGIHSGVVTVRNNGTGFVRTIQVHLHVRPTLCESLEACGLSWRTGGDMPWFGQEQNIFRNDLAAQSGGIGDNQESWIETTVEGPGQINFWWSVSSEQGFDFLEFLVNGSSKAVISGEVSWAQSTFKLPEGEHTLRWRYHKDFIFAEGADAAWLDEVVWKPTPPNRLIASDSEIAFGIVTVGESTDRTLRITNPGDTTLTISEISLPDGFSSNRQTADIGPGNFLDLVVNFSPTRLGSHAGILAITSNAVSGIHEVHFFGYAAQADDPVEMDSEKVIPGLTGDQNEQHHFVIEVPPGRDWLEIRIFGGTGDADLYVRHDAPPTLDEWDHAPFQVGNKETVMIEQPTGGLWYFMAHGYEEFADVSITARFARLRFSSWAELIDLPESERGLMDRHGPRGTTTLEGYAFGRDPRELSSTDLPRMESSPEFSGQIRLLYQVHTEATDVSVTIQSSSDLTTWTTASPTSETILSESEGVAVREALFDTEERSSLFIRARIEYQPEP